MKLRLLVFDLGVKFDDLRGEIYSEKVRSLVSFMVRRSRFADLLHACEARRNVVDWFGVAGIETV